MRSTPGFSFSTKSGMEYFYSDQSGLVFPISNSEAEIPQSASFRMIDNKKSMLQPRIAQREERFHAYTAKEEVADFTKKFTIDSLTREIEKFGYRHLYLIVTNACNLRCKYCIFSENYPYTEARAGNSRMSKATAKKAVDLYLSKIRKIREYKKERPIIITFYGGEPLLNYSVIKYVIEYVNSLNMENIIFSLTTNGVLLNEERIDFLVSNNVSIGISLDGPKEEHDRNRVFEGGKGSFDSVYKKLSLLWKKYPHYQYLTFLVTYDTAMDLESLRAFFGNETRFNKSLFLFSHVQFNFTDYYQNIDKSLHKRFSETFYRFNDELITSDKQLSDYDALMRYMIGIPLYLLSNRRIIQSIGRPGIPFTRTCLPGDKIAVTPKGDLEVCEKAPGMKIGTVAQGLDYHLILKIIDQYNAKITSQCQNCNIKRLCETCFATFWKGDGFEFPGKDFCQEAAEKMKSSFSTLYSLLEENPDFFEMIEEKTPVAWKRLTETNI
ncbi:MAG: radical SAM protein [Spirochaetales bacterium]|nr:radical SAM protein [Spirochaetales bacterium]